ncbi:MAG TPA: hypothetical protein VMS17_13265 [Gemmataceae bacterium]|nr:hypothetical protein [Gemmataceae bacterium]
MRTTFPRFVLTAVLMSCCAGCLPNATWLPDSSGFVYTGGKNKDTLYLYNLEKKASRVLVEKGAGPAWPAVSPNGKRIAVALRGTERVGKSLYHAFLEVVVFDRDGKELQRSEKMKWKDDTNFDVVAAQAFWVPGEDKLLLWSDAVTGFYDLIAKSHTLLDVNLATYRNTPIRPDGKGFLAVTKTGGPLCFVDWDGKKQDIQPTPEDASEGSKLWHLLYYPMMYSSHWDGDTAVVSWDDMRVATDADKLTASLEKIKPETTADGKVIQDQVKLADGGMVRAVELTKRWGQKHDPDDPYRYGRYRVELLKPGANEPKVLMDAAAMFMIQPSPDGKKAVVRYSKSEDAIFKTSNPNEDLFYVIDGGGDVTDKIDISK